MLFLGVGRRVCVYLGVGVSIGDTRVFQSINYRRTELSHVKCTHARTHRRKRTHSLGQLFGGVL